MKTIKGKLYSMVNIKDYFDNFAEFNIKLKSINPSNLEVVIEDDMASKLLKKIPNCIKLLVR